MDSARPPNIGTAGRTPGTRGRRGRTKRLSVWAGRQASLVGRKPQELLTTNALILLAIYLNPRASFVEIAQGLEIQESTVTRGIKQLEAQGFLSRKRPDRRNEYTIVESAQITPKSAARVSALLFLLGDNGTIKVR